MLIAPSPPLHFLRFSFPGRHRWLTAFMAEHNISFSNADHLLDCCRPQPMFPHSTIPQNNQRKGRCQQIYVEILDSVILSMLSYEWRHSYKTSGLQTDRAPSTPALSISLEPIWRSCYSVASRLISDPIIASQQKNYTCGYFRRCSIHVSRSTQLELSAFNEY